jgi:hypothetical protein
MIFAPTILGSFARFIAFRGSAWIAVVIVKLFSARGIVTRRNMPLKILLGSEDPLYEILENDNIVDQTVSVELENISDVSVRHCKLQITSIQPAIGRQEPIFIWGCLSIDSGKVERVPIAYLKKTKRTHARLFGICVPLAPVLGGDILTIPEGIGYDITIEASCDEAEENQISNCRLWINERDTLRLTER